jgi:hypothetical protein
MMNFRLIAAAALAVALASPAMAMHRDYHRHYGYIHREHAPRFGYGKLTGPMPSTIGTTSPQGTSTTTSPAETLFTDSSASCVRPLGFGSISGLGRIAA